MRRAGIQESNAKTLRGRVQALERIKYTKRRMMYLLCVPQRCPKGSYEMLENECEGQTKKKDSPDLQDWKRPGSVAILDS